ncbi:hypothetical protein [Mucilaginibacter endophyticus]|nr:hypothetical protein [Mucilaginibacter endophyticus]
MIDPVNNIDQEGVNDSKMDAVLIYEPHFGLSVPKQVVDYKFK